MSTSTNRQRSVTPEARRWALAPLLGSLLAVLILAGCGAGEGDGASAEEPDKKIVLGYVAWEESVAMAQITREILEEELGYSVELRRSEPDEVYRLISRDEVDAFQGVWLPNHFAYIGDVDADVSVLRSWLDGVTRQSIAVPDYVDARTVEDLEGSGIDRLIGPKPGAAAVVSDVPVAALARYGIAADLTYPDAEAMLEEVDRLTEEREPFAFVAWTPHWMNAEYDFEYLEDPERRIPGLIKPMDIHTAVREELASEDPVAHGLLEAMELGEYQVVAIEQEIRKADSPEEGARKWVEDNGDRAEAWAKAARRNAEE